MQGGQLSYANYFTDPENETVCSTGLLAVPLERLDIGRRFAIGLGCGIASGRVYAIVG
jgi:hypothetical protein